MRLSKTDGGVGYAYLCDGVSPASPVLSDGQLSFTPGISQTLGTPNGSGGMSYASHFYAEDGLGNLRGMSDAGAQGFPDAYNWDAFGQLIGRAGGTSTPFGYGEASGYQADGDSGLRLLGHRYYDSRTGRFISQDPAHDGGNWYEYAGNDPINSTDPTGLSLEGGGPSPFESMAAGGAGTLERNQVFLDNYSSQEDLVAQFKVNYESPSAAAKNAADWYMNGMGGTGDWVDQNLMAGTASNLGQVAGDHDSGKASDGELASAIAAASAMAVINAIPGGGAEAGIVRAGLNIGVHAAEREAQRGITTTMIGIAIRKGARFYDPKNKTINYLLRGGFASGKDLLVGRNPLTGKITTVIRGTNISTIKRMIPIP